MPPLQLNPPPPPNFATTISQNHRHSSNKASPIFSFCSFIFSSLLTTLPVAKGFAFWRCFCEKFPFVEWFPSNFRYCRKFWDKIIFLIKHICLLLNIFLNILLLFARQPRMYSTILSQGNTLATVTDKMAYKGRQEKRSPYDRIWMGSVPGFSFI